VTGSDVRDVARFEGELDSLREARARRLVLSIADWDKAMVGRSALMNSVESALNSQAQASAVELGARVQRRVLVETGLLLMTLLLGVLFAWLVARSMARALRDLRQGALAVPSTACRRRWPGCVIRRSRRTSHRPAWRCRSPSRCRCAATTSSGR
jgi:hypothetical protein